MSKLLTADLELRMEFQQRPDNWKILTSGPIAGDEIQFPSDDRIEEIWRETVPGEKELSIGVMCAGPTEFLDVHLTEGTTLTERKKFLIALFKECEAA